MLRISLIAAIVLGLAVGVVNFVFVKDKINTTLQQRDESRKTAKEEGEAHRKFEKLANDTAAALKRTNDLLVATIDERDKAVAENAELTKKNAGLTENLQKTTAERDSAQNDLAAWKALGIPIEHIKETLASLKNVTEERDAIAEEKRILSKKLETLQSKYDFVTGRIDEVVLPTGLKGKVLAADPRYDFVVLDIGDKQGVRENGRMLVNRNGKLIAKVQIKSVQADRSIANVMPGWKLDEIMEGDQVLY